MKGFVMSTDAGIAIGFAIILAGAITVMAQNSPADAFWGGAALARDYLVLQHAYSQPINVGNTPLPAYMIISQTPPVGWNNASFAHAQMYWPPNFFNCSSGSTFCSLNYSSTNATFLNGTQSIFNGSTYIYDAWMTG